jgi:phage terminase small subunit
MVMYFQSDLKRYALDSDRFMIVDTRLCRDCHDFSKDFYAKAYIRWAVENCPEHLQKFADENYIYGHIIEKVDECMAEQWKIWKQFCENDSEYRQAVENADTVKVWQLENAFELEARQIVLETVVKR